MKEIKNFTIEELKEQLSLIDIKPFKANQIFQWIYQKGIFDFSQMSNISKKDHQLLSDNFKISLPQIIQSSQSIDGTIKFAIRLYDNHIIESVLIFDEDRTTLCLSTQVGCRMGCKFCFTAKMGFKRNLEVSEIVDQILAAKFLLNNGCFKITNLVFMGMGEPLDNFENLKKALSVIMNEYGFNFSYRKITVSSCGITDKITEFGENFKINLAISLHSPFKEERDTIMPINKKYNLEELINVCRRYPLLNRQRITFEYLMIKNFNDKIKDAKELVKLLSPLKSKVNLIQFNCFPSSEYQTSDYETIIKFQDYLSSKKISTTLRKSKGQDILAACGQLSSQINSEQIKK